MENDNNVYSTLRTLLNDPKSRDAVIEFVENYKGDTEKARRTELAVEEVRNYMEHLKIVAEMNGVNNGDATKFSVFSFGEAVKASYAIDEQGNIVVDADFSTEKSRYPGDKETFDRRINPDLVDFDAVRTGLMNKYGIEFGLGYKEDSYTREEWNGSGDMESSYNMSHYNIDSHMFIKGRVLDKAIDREAPQR
jgi:hypothetical protein